jgi:EAL domain-containing protein (putative c-di-GMP-specific phosphodiesterase class I)
MIEAVIAIAKSLRMDVLAEGVETSVQRQTLLAMGCNKMQGYYFYRPMSGVKTGQLLLGKLIEEVAAPLVNQGAGQFEKEWDHSVSW